MNRQLGMAGAAALGINLFKQCLHKASLGW